MKNLVTTHWLGENMGNDNILIMDVRSELGKPEYGEISYKEGHIPGAIFVSVEDILTGEKKEHGGRHPLPDMGKFVLEINKLGVDDDKVVIIYDDGDIAMAGRLWWMLKFIGKTEAYILEGGIKRWKEYDYPLITEDSLVYEGGNLTINYQFDLIAEIEDVIESFVDNNTVLVDSRSADRFKGEVEPIDRVPGHIPNAVNYPWTDLTTDGNVLSIKELEERFNELKKYDNIIVHCGSGITGTVNIVFMEEVGLTPKLYVGGYSDWISYPENEIVCEA